MKFTFSPVIDLSLHPQKVGDTGHQGMEHLHVTTHGTVNNLL